jgi:oxygen-independent coproporphyrinogen-3 oxidase
MDQSLNFNRALVEKYDRPGSRYTSYPTAPQFLQAFAMDDYQNAVAASNQAVAPKALSLHIHILFCLSLCL